MLASRSTVVIPKPTAPVVCVSLISQNLDSVEIPPLPPVTKMTLKVRRGTFFSASNCLLLSIDIVGKYHAIRVLYDQWVQVCVSATYMMKQEPTDFESHSLQVFTEIFFID